MNKKRLQVTEIVMIIIFSLTDGLAIKIMKGKEEKQEMKLA